jgi:hypothetical protein
MSRHEKEALELIKELGEALKDRLVDKDSSGQGFDPLHHDHPFHDEIVKDGLFEYSHSVVVWSFGFPDMHHTYVSSDDPKLAYYVSIEDQRPWSTVRNGMLYRDNERQTFNYSMSVNGPGSSGLVEHFIAHKGRAWDCDADDLARFRYKLKNHTFNAKRAIEKGLKQ